MAGRDERGELAHDQPGDLHQVAAAHVRPVLVNGLPGVLAAMADGEPMSVMAFTVAGDRIVEIDSIADPRRLAALNLRFTD